MIYDIIGDIHGHADKLLGLLAKLGYTHNGKSHIAPSGHQAVFIGDFIDRGNQQLATLKIVFDMLDNHQALAVMGNHEYNAICYATLGDNGDYLRPHTTQNNTTHHSFLNEVGFGTPLHQYWIKRFYELPLWLELEHCIFIHACYDESSMAILAPLLIDNKLTENALHLTANNKSPYFFATEKLIKGIESRLPEGLTMTDKTGIVRTRARVKWWMDDWQHKPINQILFADNLPEITLPKLNKSLSNFAITTKKPIFIGHYWLHGTPNLLSNQVVCVDYSAGKDGYLTAYQFNSNQPLLNNTNFVQFFA